MMNPSPLMSALLVRVSLDDNGNILKCEINQAAITVMDSNNDSNICILADEFEGESDGPTQGQANQQLVQPKVPWNEKDSRDDADDSSNDQESSSSADAKDSGESDRAPQAGPQDDMDAFCLRLDSGDDSDDDGKEDIQVCSGNADNGSRGSSSQIVDELKQEQGTEREIRPQDESAFVDVWTIDDESISKNVIQKRKEREEEDADDASANRKKRNKTFHTIGLYKLYCAKCDKQMEKIRGLQMKNCKTCKSSLQYDCVKCESRYKSFPGVYIHIKKKCFRQASTSPNTDYKYQSKSKLKKILSDAEVYCRECNIVYESNAVTTERYSCKTCNELLFYRCTKCKKCYPHYHSAYGHLYVGCNNAPKFPCGHCNKRYKSKKTLQMHIDRQHTSKKCHSCKKRFPNVRELKEHRLMMECQGDALLKCDECPLSFYLDTHLKDHIRQEHKCKYECDECNKKFIRMESLIRHRATCGLVATFRCAHCSYEIKRKQQLAQHMKYCQPKLFN